jgi:hypothetical protein
MENFKIDRDPVNMFWSIVFIIANIFFLSFIYNSLIYDTCKGVCMWSSAVYIIICSVCFLEAFDKYKDSDEVPLWTFASIVNIATLLVVFIVYKINSTIRNIAERSNENIEPKSKPFLKRIISKIIGIK